jgi:hypothetical protein
MERNVFFRKPKIDRKRTGIVSRFLHLSTPDHPSTDLSLALLENLFDNKDGLAIPRVHFFPLPFDGYGQGKEISSMSDTG